MNNLQISPPIILAGYGIYNTKTGLWSKGGTNPIWKKNGKIWRNISHVKNHISMALISMRYANKYNDIDQSHFYVSNIYKDCIIVDLTTMEEVSNEMKIYEYVADYIKRQMDNHKYYSGYTIRYQA